MVNLFLVRFTGFPPFLIVLV